MSLSYRVDLESNTGVLLEQFNDFIALQITGIWNGKGNYRLTLSGFDDRVLSFEKDSIVRVWRKDIGTDWLNIFNGIHKTFDDSLESAGQRIYTSFGPALEELVAKAMILYPSGSPQARKIGACTTVMYSYVEENVGTSATAANGRDIDHVNPIVNAIDPSDGPNWSGSNSRKNLLSTLQAITAFSREQGDPVDFRVNYLGGFNFQFEAGKLAVDRTAPNDPTQPLNPAGNVPVIFGVNYGNVQDIGSSESRFNESNVVIALGQGNTDSRDIGIAINAGSVGASAIAQRESTINATRDSQQNDLDAVASARLQERIAENKLFFTSRPNTAQSFFVDYNLGDLVTGEDLRGNRQNKQIVKYVVNVRNGGDDVENIRLEFSDIL